jgi:hypothetical protein
MSGPIGKRAVRVNTYRRLKPECDGGQERTGAAECLSGHRLVRWEKYEKGLHDKLVLSIFQPTNICDKKQSSWRFRCPFRD